MGANINEFCLLANYDFFVVVAETIPQVILSNATELLVLGWKYEGCPISTARWLHYLCPDGFKYLQPCSTIQSRLTVFS